MVIQIVGDYLEWGECMAEQNPCYRKGVRRAKTTRLILHSVGANNAWLKRWISPDDGLIGDDGVANGWNRADADTLVHFVIGLDKNGTARAYQIAPLNLRVWGCGSGKNGNGNDISIQVEMTEDGAMGAALARANYAVAVDLFASLCRMYGLDSSAIWSHREAHAAGWASNHGDPEAWFESSGSGLTMAGFRKDVQRVLDTGTPYGGGTGNPAESTGGSGAAQSQTAGGTALEKEEFEVAKTYQNGSTAEPVYADTAKKTRIGSLNPWETCDCLGKAGSMYIVRYKVDGTSAYKVGLVSYAGGLG